MLRNMLTEDEGSCNDESHLDDAGDKNGAEVEEMRKREESI